MSADYGPGVLDHLADGEDGQKAEHWLRTFAGYGLTSRFREIIGERVAEFTFDDATVGHRWLPDDQGAHILAGVPSGGSASGSRFPTAMDADMYLPNCLADGEGRVEDEGSPFDGWGYQSLDVAIAELEGLLVAIERGDYDGDPEFILEMVESLKYCAEHQLIFMAM